MNQLEIASPASIGFDPERLALVYRLLEQWTRDDEIPGAGLAIGRRGAMLAPRVFGRRGPERDAMPLREDAIFLIASPTKPLAVLAAMLLVERGLLTLGDRVADHVPEFAASGKARVEVRHLMTHTSGLPDMLPENLELRRQRKPIEEFVRRACAIPIDFEPGTAVRYQSMGIAVLGEIVRRISGKPLPDFLRDEVFQPLGLEDTALGAPDAWWDLEPRKAERIARVRIAPEAEAAGWSWNSRYWLGFGAPWGGLLTTPAEYARICQEFLDALAGPESGRRAGDRKGILSPATARAMTSNQLEAMESVPEPDRRARPWGLGWRLQWPGRSENFGDLLGPLAFGHWGATGTLVWMDPDADAFLVLFTTQPQEPDGKYLAKISSMVCAALNGKKG